MANIEVLDGISIPYEHDKESKKWSGTVEHSWDTKNQYVQAFAEEAERKIRKRAKNHGTIPYPPKLKSLAHSLNHYRQNEQTLSFADFVTSVQTSSAISLKTSRVQSKLVLIFLTYRKERDDSTKDNPIFIENLLVILLKDKSALQFGDDGSPKGTEIIDFEDVMQGAMIDLYEFDNCVEKQQGIDVSFINGSGGTTDYFVDFFDAEDVIKNKESVTNVLKALNDFLETKNLNRTQRERCTSKVIAKIDFNERQKFATKLQELSSVIYSSLRTEKDIDISKSSFEDFVQEYNYKVNEEFKITKTERDTLEFISLDTDVGALKLKKSLFKRKGVKGNIEFNSNNNELTVKTKIKDPQTIEELNKLQND